eukprot:TRINITY_DN2754_c0_g1_i4.p1 TRINITY_DN2754_c0_g1~~TRINITY_DN2754_c0_g1_i4.p1  ORF type:complete len:321 (-),score=107.98 TRINITY_DN2754_c0_g1_i4:1553-2515(-)
MSQGLHFLVIVDYPRWQGTWSSENIAKQSFNDMIAFAQKESGAKEALSAYSGSLMAYPFKIATLSSSSYNTPFEKLMSSSSVSSSSSSSSEVKETDESPASQSLPDTSTVSELLKQATSNGVTFLLHSPVSHFYRIKEKVNLEDEIAEEGKEPKKKKAVSAASTIDLKKYKGLTVANILEKWLKVYDKEKSNSERAVQLEYLEMKFSSVWKQKEWTTLPKAAIQPIVSSDHINCASEVEVAQALVRWALTQIENKKSKSKSESTTDTKEKVKEEKEEKESKLTTKKKKTKTKRYESEQEGEEEELAAAKKKNERKPKKKT